MKVIFTAWWIACIKEIPSLTHTTCCWTSKRRNALFLQMNNINLILFLIITNNYHVAYCIHVVELKHGWLTEIRETIYLIINLKLKLLYDNILHTTSSIQIIIWRYTLTAVCTTSYWKNTSCIINASVAWGALCV
jgi:hypothetical protein